MCAQAPPSATPRYEWKDRWSYYLHRTYSWQRMSLLAADTAFDHLMGEPGEWARDPECYAWRYGSAFGHRVVRNTIELGAGAALGEDARFRLSQAAGFRARVRYAAIQAFAGYRGERRVFAYSRLAGAIGGAGPICLGAMSVLGVAAGRARRVELHRSTGKQLSQ